MSDTMINKLNNILGNVDEVYNAGVIKGASSGGEIDIPIDQEYDSTSTNAQSGIAVAQAVSGKMDKFGEVDKNGNVDITNYDFTLSQGSDTYINFDDGDIKIRGGSRLYLQGEVFSEKLYVDSSPTYHNEVVNKAYVDTNKEDFSNKKDIITEDIVKDEPDAYPTVGAVYNFVNEQIGDIETALTNIEDIQNALIGGNV